jgi:hypothetical protein
MLSANRYRWGSCWLGCNISWVLYEVHGFQRLSWCFGIGIWHLMQMHLFYELLQFYMRQCMALLG